MNTARTAPPRKAWCWYPLMLLLALLVPAASDSRAQAVDSEALQRALSSERRDFMQRLRDEQRQPLAVMAFLQVAPGMRVLDLYAAEGYFSYVLSHAVGADGEVLAQNPPRSREIQPGFSGDDGQPDALDITISRGQLANVRRLDRPVSNLELTPASVDLVLMSQILHDYFNSSPARALQVLSEVYRVMKPGAVLGVIDHRGIAGQDNHRLHRMLEQHAISIVTEAGFVLEADSALLANPADNARRSIFDPMLARNSDQFLLRFRKPH